MIFNSSDLGRLARAWRESRGITQQDMAEELGSTNRNVIAMVETGTLLEAMHRMARLYYCELPEFEAEDFRKLTETREVARSLYDSRQWLRLTHEFVAEKTGLPIAAVISGESAGHVDLAMRYIQRMLEACASQPELLTDLLHHAIAPWHWTVERKQSAPRGRKAKNRDPEPRELARQRAADCLHDFGLDEPQEPDAG